MKSLNKYFIALGLVLMGGALAVSLIDQETAGNFLSSPVNWVAIVAAVFLIIAFGATFSALEAMKIMIAAREGRLKTEEDEVVAEERKPSWASALLAKLQDSKPVQEEEEIELDHEYDGIRELDNNLPPWWLYGFYATIIFSVIYLVRYHVTQSAPLPEEEYQMEMAAAAAQKEEYLKNAANLVDETNVTAVTEGPRILNGEAIFKKNCGVCHANDGGGGVGPNLTDAYWLHGGSINDVFETIKYGVPSKGMIAWQDQLSPKDIQDVATFIMTLQGTTPGDPKEPQGDMYEASEVPDSIQERTIETEEADAGEGQSAETAEL